MGKIDFLEGQNVSVSNEARELIEKEKSDGKTITTIAINGRVAGVIGVMDEIKPNVKVTLEELRKLGVKDIVMLTGDNKYVAARIAKEVGITDFHADLLPEDKLRMIQELSKKDGVTVMVGDGVNDAAALQIANIGVAMGAIGYDAAIESADIVLMKDDISRLVEVMKLSRYLRVVSIQDFWIWGITNIFGLALVFTGVIGPTGAAAYNFISDFIPLFNSLKVTQLKFRKHGKSHDVSYT
jgi:Cd2+/Zn2+-exporting ATPase